MKFPKMVDQKSRMKSKPQVFQFKSCRLCFQTLMVGLCVLSLSISSIQTATCPASVPISAAITTEQYTFDLHFGGLDCNFILSSILRSFLTYTNTYTIAIAACPVSKNLYYMYWLQPEKKEVRFKSYIIHIQCAQNKYIFKGKVINHKLYLLCKIN